MVHTHTHTMTQGKDRRKHGAGRRNVLLCGNIVKCDIYVMYLHSIYMGNVYIQLVWCNISIQMAWVSTITLWKVVELEEFQNSLESSSSEPRSATKTKNLTRVPFSNCVRRSVSNIEDRNIFLNTLNTSSPDVHAIFKFYERPNIQEYFY